MAFDISSITDIHTEAAIYVEKVLCAWCDMHAPGAGVKHCWVPNVRYLGSGSEDKALSRCISKMFWNMGAQYTAGNFL